MASPSVTTGAAIILAAQERADLVGSGFVSPAEWLRYLNASYAELYGVLVTTYGADFYTQSPSTGYLVTADGLASHYTLPTDFLKLLGVDLLVNGSGETGVYAALRQFNFGERNRGTAVSIAGLRSRTNIRYRLNGNTLWFQPLPSAGQVFRVFYAPRPATLDGTGGTGDVVDEMMGWGELLVVDLAIKGKQKAEEDVSVLMAQKAALLQRIANEAENRDIGNPATVMDTQRMNWGGGDGWDGGTDGMGGW